ncbi:MAG: DUF5317 domain-containing protein [Actinobacteria bacterium]|nr:DUF5317 domain-containing protein [Actinomycetota bacterium]
MFLVVPIALVAALYGLVRGGSLEPLAQTQFRLLWILFAALVAQVGFDLWDPAWLSQTGDLVVLLTTNAAIVVFLAANRHLPGMLLAALGLLLNVIVISANAGMPVSQEAAEIAGLEGELTNLGIKHEVLGPDTVFPWLADVIPLPGLNALISVGDVVLAAGIGWLVYRRTLDEGPNEDRDSATPAATSG